MKVWLHWWTAVFLLALGAMAVAAQSTPSTLVSSPDGRLDIEVDAMGHARSIQVDSRSLSQWPAQLAGWGAGSATRILCVTAACPPTMAIHSTEGWLDNGTWRTTTIDSHASPTIRVHHAWSTAAFAGVIRADVVVENAGTTALDDARYRRGHAFAWDGACCPAMSFGAQGNASALLLHLAGSSNLGKADPTPGAAFDAAPSGLDGTCVHHPGPGPDSGGAPFDDVWQPDQSPCWPGAMAELLLGDLAPGGQAAFTMWYGWAATEPDALHLLGPNGLDARFWFLAQDPMQASTGTPFTFFWAFSETQCCAPAPPCPADGCGPGCAEADCGAECQALGCGTCCTDDGAGDRKEPPQEPGGRTLHPPVAAFHYEWLDQGHVRLTDDSYDRDGLVASRSWAVDDATFTEASFVLEADPSRRQVLRLTVWDDTGLSDSIDITLSPLGPPRPDPAPSVPPSTGDACPSCAACDACLPCTGCADAFPALNGPPQAIPDARRTTHPVAEAAAPVPAPAPPFGPFTGPALVGGGTLLLALVPRLAPWIVVAFSRLRRQSLLDHPLRNRILELATADPGIHLRELARCLGRSKSAARHHVRVLAAAGLLRTRQTGVHLHCYPADAPLPALDLPEGSRRILEVARSSPGASIGQLAAGSGLSYSAAHHHLRRLEAAGLLSLQASGAGPLRAYPKA